MNYSDTAGDTAPAHDIASETLCRWMDCVVDRAWQGVAEGQSPFAAAIYGPDGTQLSLENNIVKASGQPSRHAEVCAIDSACQQLGQCKLDDCWLLATGEPCPMCAATAAMADIHRIVFGASADVISQAGYATLELDCEKFYELTDHQPLLIGGVQQTRCEELLLKNPKR
ncbi:MAG: nucleoside deaminase [Pirellulaceae bacterium]|nr:nucleoside deaminase [Pirellulaceae bacterium]